MQSRIVVVMKILYRQQLRAVSVAVRGQHRPLGGGRDLLAVLELMKNKRVMLEEDGSTIRLL